MPPLFRTASRVRIDWDGDGRYAHTDSDVTNNFESYFVRFGLDTTSDEERLVTVPARGSLILNNDSGLYSSEKSGSIGAPLRQPQKITIEHRGSGFTRGQFEGIVEPPEIELLPKQANKAIFSITSEHADAMVSEFNISHVDPIPFSTAFAAIPNEASAGNSLPSMNLGIVDYNGSLQTYIERLAVVGGSVAFENRRGGIVMQNVAQLASSVAATTVTPSNRVSPVDFKILRDDTKVYRRQGLVRNAAQLEERRVVVEPISETVAVTRVVAPADGSPHTNYAFTSDPSIVGVVWPDASALATLINAAQSNVSCTVSAVTPQDYPRVGISFTVINRGPAALDATIQISARPSRVKTTWLNQYRNAASVTAYGERSYDWRSERIDHRSTGFELLPPWLDRAASAVTEAWIDRLASPPLYAELSFPVWQRTRSETDALIQIEPGQLRHVEIDDVDGVTVREWMLVVGKEVAHIYQRVPRIRLFLIGLGVTSGTTPVGFNRWGQGRWGQARWQ